MAELVSSCVISLIGIFKQGYLHFTFRLSVPQMAVHNRREEGKTPTPSALMGKIQMRPK